MCLESLPCALIAGVATASDPRPRRQLAETAYERNRNGAAVAEAGDEGRGRSPIRRDLVIEAVYQRWRGQAGTAVHGPRLLDLVIPPTHSRILWRST